MSTLVRHFGDEEDAARSCGTCDICDPAGAILRLFRRATNAERTLAQSIVDELRPVDYKAAGTLQKAVDPAARLTRDDFDGILDAMTRACLISIEDAEYEKDGEVRRYRKVSLTETGLATRSVAQIELLLSDGIAEEFAATENRKRARSDFNPERNSASEKKSRSSATVSRSSRPPSVPLTLSANGEALATRLKEWRTSEAKRLRVPPYCILHDRTLTAVALARPENPRQLLEIDGIGPSKVEKFGPAILGICGAKF
jgi:superfamily II DNA helicase RecQ